MPHCFLQGLSLAALSDTYSCKNVLHWYTFLTCAIFMELAGSQSSVFVALTCWEYTNSFQQLLHYDCKRFYQSMTHCSFRGDTWREFKVERGLFFSSTSTVILIHVPEYHFVWAGAVRLQAETLWKAWYSPYQVIYELHSPYYILLLCWTV